MSDRERLAAELRDAVGDNYDNGKMSDPYILWHESGIPDAIDWNSAADVLIKAGVQFR